MKRSDNRSGHKRAKRSPTPTSRANQTENSYLRKHLKTHILHYEPASEGHSELPIHKNQNETKKVIEDKLITLT